MTNNQKKSAAEWQALVDAFEASQLKLKDFCEAQGVTRYALHYWQKKSMLNLGSRPAGGLVEIKPLSVPSHGRTVGGSIRIIFPSGIIVEPGTSWNQDELTRALATVRSL